MPNILNIIKFIVGEEYLNLAIIGKRMSVNAPLSRPTISTVITLLSNCN